MNGIILGTIGLWQFVIIALVIVLLFGSAKIPELMRNLGKGIGEFKKSTKGEDKSEAVKKDEKQPEEK
ncbi:MAG TPA: twin-arginine translocase TatA/TatE family subunit [Candidatus Merdimorpha stercoravium]|uniref:Sec-independent protein translocase protein TatA n=1 Tax=Candidatus Merdimorpha stercoravium TaxID=2840863 RepID=A0A9D1H9P2_9FLAO|nr:twin-arginine translocase TatA/TatE family subunit [Candidatus Merdimorpha stercoravium]